MNFIKTVKKICKEYMEEKFPFLTQNYYPVYARVIHCSSGFVSIKLLDRNRNLDQSIPDIPIRDDRIFEAGDTVGVIFFYNDLSSPYILGRLS